LGKPSRVEEKFHQRVKERFSGGKEGEVWMAV